MSLQNSYVKTLTPSTSNVAVFGDKAFKEIHEFKMKLLAWDVINLTGVLLRRHIRRHTGEKAAMYACLQRQGHVRTH